MTPESRPGTGHRDRPRWLSRIETLGSTLIVLMVGGMVLWFKAAARDPRVALAIGSGILVYVLGLVGLGRRSTAAAIAWWPFAGAGLAAGAVAELINAKMLLTREFAVASLIGIVVGTAQWAALRIWLRLTGSGAA